MNFPYSLQIFVILFSGKGEGVGEGGDILFPDYHSENILIQQLNTENSP